jgi:hypothetical protein
MEKEFISYEQALILKELGFNEPCFGWWFVDEKMLFIEKSKKSTSDNILQAPLKQQVFEWFRNVHNYHVSIRKRYFQTDGRIEYNYFIYPPNSNEHLEHNLLDEYDTWEEAESACIDDLIKLVKGDGTIDFICPDPNCPHCNYNE